jgi:uncharacterized membrane protein YfcA
MNGFELTVILAASFLGMFVKSVTGMGYPLFAIPLISLSVGVENAVVIVSAPNVIANALLCFGARQGAEQSRDLGRLATSGVLGAFVGAIALVTLPEWPLLLMLVVTIAVFVLQYWHSPNLRIAPATSRRWSPLVGGLAGVMQGAVGVSGPVVAAWLHGYRLDREAQVFSVTLLFLVSGVAQVIFLLGAGAYTTDRVVASTLVLIPVLVMIPIGTRVRDRLSGPGFDRAVLAVLVVSAVALLARMGAA